MHLSGSITRLLSSREIAPEVQASAQRRQEALRLRTVTQRWGNTPMSALLIFSMMLMVLASVATPDSFGLWAASTGPRPKAAKARPKATWGEQKRRIMQASSINKPCQGINHAKRMT